MVSSKKKSKPGKGRPTLLAGGNPQIAKADGDAPVQAYIRAMPGWKRDVGRRVDALMTNWIRQAAELPGWDPSQQP